MDVFDRHVIDRFNAVRLDRVDRDGEPLAVQLPAVRRQRLLKARLFGQVLEADQVGIAAQVVAADDQLMHRKALVVTRATAAVGQALQAGGMAVAVDRRRDAQPRQHALHGLQLLNIRLGQPHADALVLRALHRAIRIEQPAQQATMEIGRCGFHRRCDALVARHRAEVAREIAQACRGEPDFSAPANRALPPLKVRPAVDGRAQGRLGHPHDAADAGRRLAHIAADGLEFGRPDGQHRLVGLQRAVADQQAQQIALGLAVRTVPALQGAVIVQHQFVARLHLGGSRPLGLNEIARLARDAAYRVVAGQPQRMPLPGAEPQHGLHARDEESLRLGRIGLAVDDGLEGPSDQLADLAGALAGQGPRLGRHARVGRCDGLAVMQVVVGVDAVQEEHAGLGMVVGGAHDLVPQRAGADLAVDPQPVAALVGAGLDLLGAGLGLVHQLHRAVGLHRLHEGVGHADRDVEVAQVALVLGMDELFNVRVVAAQHAHLRAAAAAGAFHRLAGPVEHAHIADRPRGMAAGGAHPGAGRADAAEVIAHAAAAAHRLGRFGEGRVDAGHAVFRGGDAVAHRLHEAVDQRGRQLGAGRGHDAAGRHEAALLGVEEGGRPTRTVGGLLGLRQRTGDALAQLVGRLLAALGIFFDQDLAGDVLNRQFDGGAHGRLSAV
mmetsp:Transcript_21920/g.61690  ORF Transcript_21920/g.61690 Transcript_21920/m.61690 type:complete len:665 (+) Transcript_21920:1171-3165(+)